jgi:5-formyltetrahydrofolate cyclo-ligase
LRLRFEASLRAVTPFERARAGLAASHHLVSFLAEHVPAGAPIALFAETPLELPIEPATRALARRHPLAFPIVRAGTLAFLAAGLDELSARANKVREPPSEAPVLAPRAIVVPGRGFDRRGVRLGRGRGYYDRALAAAGADTLTIGFCFERQVVESLPFEEHDQRLQWLATEVGVRALAPG